MNVFFSKKKSFDIPVMFYKRQRGYLGTICPEYQVHPIQVWEVGIKVSMKCQIEGCTEAPNRQTQ